MEEKETFIAKMNKANAIVIPVNIRRMLKIEPGSLIRGVIEKLNEEDGRI
jgi:bifunctional DNA-binding transcriptional regulator/antitoxin component of YhaV-PrlF toxin-antitoxin module